MAEVYTGTKFETVFLDQSLPDYHHMEEIKRCARYFAELQMAPTGGEGNLSFRSQRGFVVTATASRFADLEHEDFVEVERVDSYEKVFYIHGVREPSSESFMHNAIYNQRSEIHVIFHTHDQMVMDSNDTLGFPETAQAREYGTLELVREVLKVSRDNDYFIIKEHGVVAVGDSILAASDKILKARSLAEENT